MRSSEESSHVSFVTTETTPGTHYTYVSTLVEPVQESSHDPGSANLSHHFQNAASSLNTNAAPGFSNYAPHVAQSYSPHLYTTAAQGYTNLNAAHNNQMSVSQPWQTSALTEQPAHNVSSRPAQAIGQHRPTTTSSPSFPTPPPSVGQAAFRPTSNQNLMQPRAPAPNVAAAANPTYADLGIVTERPKRTEFALVDARRQTFHSWPDGHHIKVQDMVDCGLYYAGYGDCARCFYCGGGLRNWDENDNVFVEHARWFPKCGFIRQKVGQAFIDAVQKLNKEQEQISFDNVMVQMGPLANAFKLDCNEPDIGRDPAVKTLLDMGYQLDTISRAIMMFRNHGNGILSADTLITLIEQGDRQETGMDEECLDTTYRDTLRELRESNQQLRQQTICKICMDKEVTIVFLPCGHLVSCTECAVALNNCPVCRTTIKGTVRAFIT